LARHHVSRFTDASTQGLFLQNHKEASISGVEDPLTLYARREGLIQVVGDLIELDSVSDDGRRILRRLEQSRHQTGLVDPEQPGPLIERN
jgi:hypothetical protein